MGRESDVGDRRSVACEEARETLWPWDRPRVHTEREATALAHVEACEACRTFFRRDQAVARAIREYGPGARAPRELRERVYGALARERAFRSLDPEPSGARAWKGRSRIATALAALLALVGIGWLFVTLRPEPSQDAYVQDFVGRAVAEEVVEAPDPGRVSRFFMRELGLNLPPVSLDDGRLSRAMICLIRGRRAAMVEYELGGYTVAHYRLPRSGVRGRPRELRISSERGVSVIHWEDEAFEHALVSDLSGDRLAHLAREEFAAR